MSLPCLCSFKRLFVSERELDARCPNSHKPHGSGFFSWLYECGHCRRCYRSFEEIGERWALYEARREVADNEKYRLIALSVLKFGELTMAQIGLNWPPSESKMFDFGIESLQNVTWKGEPVTRCIMRGVAGAFYLHDYGDCWRPL